MPSPLGDGASGEALRLTDDLPRDDDGFIVWEDVTVDRDSRDGPTGANRWTTLAHNGPMFPEPYAPHGIPVLYEGQVFKMTPEEEEVATMFATLREHERDYNDPVFRRNFFGDFLKVLSKRGDHPVRDLNFVNFDAIWDHHCKQREAKRVMLKEAKRRTEAAQEAIAKKFGWCLVDGRKVRVPHFRIEPPGLFRGRGEHPHRGMLKRRVFPEHVTINNARGVNVPPPPRGHEWGEVVCDPAGTWLCKWHDGISDLAKYIHFVQTPSPLREANLEGATPMPQRGPLSETRQQACSLCAPWHRVADVVERVAAFAGDVPTLLAMRLVSHLWLGAVRRRAVDAHDATGTLEHRQLDARWEPLAQERWGQYTGPRVACGAPLTDFTADAPQSQRMFFVAMAMLCAVAAPTAEAQRSDDAAVAAAADADLVLAVCESAACHDCLPTQQLWSLRRCTPGALRLRGAVGKPPKYGADPRWALPSLPHSPRLRHFATHRPSFGALDMAELASHAPLLEHFEILAETRGLHALPSLRCLQSLNLSLRGTRDAALIAGILTVPSLRMLATDDVHAPTWTAAIERMAAREEHSQLTSLSAAQLIYDDDQDHVELLPASEHFPPDVFPALRVLQFTNFGPPAFGGHPATEDHHYRPLGGMVTEVAPDRSTWRHLWVRDAAPDSAEIGRRLAQQRDGLESLVAVDALTLVDAFLRHADAARALRYLRIEARGPDALSAATLDATMAQLQVLDLRRVTLPAPPHGFFRGLRSLRRLHLANVASHGPVLPSFWTGVDDAVSLEHLTVWWCPSLPPISTAQPLAALTSVTITQSPYMLGREEAWLYLLRLPRLRALTVDLNRFSMNAAESAVKAARRAVTFDGCLWRRLESLTLTWDDSGHVPSDLSPLFIALTGLKTLRLKNFPAMRGCCLAALPHPERLQELHFEAERHEVDAEEFVPQIARMPSLRHVTFLADPPAEGAGTYLGPLTHGCPLLRTITVPLEPSEQRLSVEITTTSGTVEAQWTRTSVQSPRWTRVSGLAFRAARAVGAVL